jgi:hypothetical protein
MATANSPLQTTCNESQEKAAQLHRPLDLGYRCAISGGQRSIVNCLCRRFSRNLRDVSKMNVYTNVFGLDYPPYHKASVAKTITEIPAVPIR